MIHDDLKTRDEMKKLQEGYSCKDLRYANMSRTQVILLSYKGTFRGQTTSRRVKKKKEMHICMKSIGKLQLKVEKYESKEDRIMLLGQERKKARNGRVQKMQGAACSGLITRDKYALRGSVEIYNAYLEHSRRLWKSYNA